MLDLPPVLPREVTAARLYDAAIVPMVRRRAPAPDPDALALRMDTPEALTARRAAMLSLQLAEYAADQADDRQSRPVLEALIECVDAANDLLHGLDHGAALDRAEGAAESLRLATETLIEAWGLEG